jgi:DNA-binding XRE family transcriptional regulator
MRNEMMEIGSSIRKRRELLGLLQPRLAAIAGVSRRTLQLIEAGKANPSLDILLKIADPLGLTVKLTLKEPGSGTITGTEPPV